MTDGNEIINVFVLEGDVPTLPPNHPRERRVCACYQRPTPLQLVLGRRRCSPARPRRNTTGNRPRACCCSPLRKRGAGAGPSGVKN